MRVLDRAVIIGVADQLSSGAAPFGGGVDHSNSPVQVIDDVKETPNNVGVSDGLVAEA